MARWMVKAVAVTPGLIVSTTVTVMVGTALPPAAGTALFFGGLLTATALLLGRGEAAVARVLWSSRPARPAELAVMGPALTLLCRAGWGPPVVELRVRSGKPSIAAGGVGRRTVVLSGGLVEAVAAGTLPQEQAAAVIAHAAALTQGGWVRADAVIAFWSLPRQVLKGIAGALAQVGRRLPFTSVAWRMRGVVLTIAVVQHTFGLAVVIGAVGALSYLTPMWERRWQQALVDGGDDLVREAGLGAALVSFLRRCPPTPDCRARLRRLDPPRQSGPHLGLVTTRR